MKIARYYEKKLAKKVKCTLCPNGCIIRPGTASPCRSRRNDHGRFTVTNYAKSLTPKIESIEDIPLYHFLPGEKTLSVGANSCNLHCIFCNTADVSQKEAETVTIEPEELAEYCLENEVKIVSFTFTEPILWIEYIFDAVKNLKLNGIKIVLNTNGFINEEPLLDLIEVVDALNIDLKATNDLFYQISCFGQVEPVLETIRLAYEHGVHIEISNLLIPNKTDDIGSIQGVVDFIESIDKNIPLHFGAYKKAYRMHEKDTDDETVIRAVEIAKSRLNYVYSGKVEVENFNLTLCPKCGAEITNRAESTTTISNLANGRCTKCGHDIYGIF